MPRIPENDAFALAQNIDSLTGEDQVKALDVLTRYKQQQDDLGEPEWPSQVQAAQDRQNSLRSLFTGGLDKVPFEVSQWSKDPAADKATFANMSFLSARYGKTPQEIADRHDFYRNDYASQFFGQPGGVDDKTFYGLATKQIAGEQAVEDAANKGAEEAINGTNTLEAMAQNAMDNPDKEAENKAFFAAHRAVSDAVDPYRSDIKRVGEAMDRVMSGGNEPDEKDLATIEAARERLLDIPGTTRRLVMQAMWNQAAAKGKDVDATKGFLQTFGESFSRNSRGMFGAGEVTRDAAPGPMGMPLDEAAIEAVPETGTIRYDKPIKTREDASAFVLGYLRNGGRFEQKRPPQPDQHGLFDAGEDHPEVKLTPEQSSMIQQAKAREEKRLRVGREFEAIAKNADPATGMVGNVLGSTASMGFFSAGTGRLAMPILGQGYANMEYNKLRMDYPMMEAKDAKTISILSGGAQAAMDRIQIGAFKRLPSLKDVLEKGVGQILTKRVLGAGALSWGTETGVEIAQDYTTPVIQSAMAAVKKDTLLDVDWDKETSFLTKLKENGLAMLPLTLMGIGAMSISEYKGMSDRKTWFAQNKIAGVQEADLLKVDDAMQSGDMTKAQSLYQEAWGRRDPEVSVEGIKALDEQQQSQQAANDELTRIGMLPDIQRDGKGYTVSADGQTARFPTWDDARQAATQHMNENERHQADLVAHMADSFISGTPDIIKGGESFGIRQRSVSLAERVRSGQMTAEDAMEAAVAGGVIKGMSVTEARQIAQSVFGESQEERTMAIRREVERLMVLGSNKVENGQSRSTINMQGNERAFLTVVEEAVEGRWKAGLAAKHFDKAQGLAWVKLAEQATGEKFLEGMTHEDVAASNETSPRALTEAISRIVTADVLGRLKDGKRIGPGAVSRGLNLAEREQSALAAILNAFRQFFATILNTAAKLTKARKEGKLGAEYDALFDKLTGDGTRWEHEQGTLKEAASIAKEAGGSGETHSLRSGDFQARVDKVFSDFAKTPEKRLALMQAARSRVQKEMTKLREILDARAAGEQTLAEGEIRHAEAVAKLREDMEADEAQIRQDRDFELQGVTQDKGSELDRERIRREADNKLKQRRIQFERELAAVDERLASGELKGAKAGAGIDRQKIKAIMRVMEAAVSTLPMEIRGKIGNFSQVATMTDEKAIDAVEAKIRKADAEFEKYLKKEISAQVDKLLERGKPKAESGKKAKGKDADMHMLFAAAEAAQSMDANMVAGELAKMDTLMTGDDITPEQETMMATQRGLVELFGDWKHADAARMEAALETLRYIHTDRWLKWKLAEIERKERRAGMRQDFIDDTGKTGLKPERDAADKAAVTLLGKIKGGFLSLSSFHEVLSYAFGENSARVKSLVDAEREAAGQYEDVNQALADEVEELFTDMAGGTLAGERLRFDMAQRTIKTAKGEFSQFEAIQALLMWRQEDGRRHMEGHLDESGKPVGKWHYDQAWIDEITKALTPEARILMSWIMKKYGAEWATLNPLYRARYGVNMPAHDNYAPITVAPAQTKAGEIVDPVTGAAMSSGSILTPGSLRTRSRNAIAEPEFRDALQTLLIHTRQLEYWKSYYDLAVEANAILGNREVLNAVKAKGGDPAATALRKWVDAIAQGGFRDASASLEMNKLLGRMTGRAASVGLLGRFSTLLVQSTQLAAASVKMPLGAYLRGMSRLLTGNLGYGDAIKSDFIQRRFKSAPPIVRQAMESLGSASKPNQVTRAARGLGQLLSGADALFTAGTYALLLDYHRGTGRALGLSGAELEEHAHTEAERDTEQVAQPTRMATRSLMEITSTNPLAKVSWAYASEARQKIALAAWAATKAASEPAQFAKTMFLVFGVGGLMTQLLKNLWKEAKGDDDEKKWSPGRMVIAALAGPLHGIPLASELSGDGGMLSGAVWAWPALKDIASGEGDMRDVDTLLSTAGYFNDTAAGVAALSHAGLDAAKVLENLFSGK